MYINTKYYFKVFFPELVKHTNYSFVSKCSCASKRLLCITLKSTVCTLTAENHLGSMQYEYFGASPSYFDIKGSDDVDDTVEQYQ